MSAVALLTLITNENDAVVALAGKRRRQDIIPVTYASGPKRSLRISILAGHPSTRHRGSADYLVLDAIPDRRTKRARFRHR